MSQTARRAIRPAEILRGCRSGNLPVCAVLAALLLVSAVPGAFAQDASKPNAASKPDASSARQDTATKTGDAVKTNPPAKSDAASAKPDAATAKSDTAKPDTAKPDTASKPDAATAKPDKASAQDSVAKQQPELPAYPDKDSGDRARAEMEYGTAASFYRQYRAKAEQAGDVKAQKDAYACELDALISAKLADSAQKLLDEYRAKFQPDPKSVSLWQAEIYLIQRKADEADKLLQELIPSLEKLDPGLLRALSCAAFVAELNGDLEQAAKYYGEIAADAGVKSSFGRSAVERQALALTSLGKYEDAYNLLNSLPVADNKRDLDAIRLLNFYLTLSEKGPESLAEEWSEIRSISAPRKDNFFFLAACRIGDEFLRLKETVRAAEAFHLAYGFASVREDALTAMQRLMNAFDILGRKKEAAELAMRMLSFFKDVQLSPDFKLRIAAILFQSDRPDEALDVCLSCISDAAPSGTAREKAYRDALDVMIREEAFASAGKFIDAFDTTPEGKAARAMDRAEIAWRGKKFADAAKRYRAVGESSAEFRQEALLNAMRCCRDAGQYDEMLEIAALLRRDDPGHPVPDMLLLSAVAQDSMSVSEQDESARTELLSAAARNYLDYEAAASKTESNRTSREQALFRAGQLLNDLGKPGEAANVFRRYCQNYDSTGAARYWLIHCLYASGDEVGAERESWRFIEESPESQYAGAAMLRLAEHYRGSGSVQHAESTLEQLLSQNKYPRILALATYERALIAFQRDELAAATRYLDKIDVSDPKNAPMADIHYLRGDIARALNDFAKARTEYEAAAKAAAGTRLEQAALGSAADCLFALAAGSAAKNPSGPAETSADKDKASEEKGPVSADGYRRAAEAYQSLLKMKNLLPEYRAMAVYKAGQSLWKAGDEQAAFDLFRQMIYLIPAQDAAVRPVEAYWVFRAVEALESLAHKEPVIANVESAVSALEWLRQTGTVDQASVRQRIRALRKKQYQPPLPASSTSTPTSESSQQ